MSDVILYAALKENQKLNTELLQLCTGGASASISDFAEGAISAGYPYTSAGGASAETPGTCCPTALVEWTQVLTPFVETNTYGFKVCDTSGYYRCGSSCTWCVPPGVTRVQFQIWGPGGGTSGNCCCGGSPFGPSGAYAVVKMDVTPGNCYCLCGGCAYCCYANQNQPGICGSPSFVAGPGLNVCADSGVSCYNYWAQDINASGHGQGSSCGVPHFDGCSVSSCDGFNFCWDTGNDNTTICHAYSRQTWHLVCGNESCNIEAYGLNGMWPSMNIGQDLQNSTYSVSPPVFGYENMTCCVQWTGNTCRGCCYSAQNGYQQGPGFGGFADRKFGGCDGCGGDSGGMGMICVSWECN